MVGIDDREGGRRAEAETGAGATGVQDSAGAGLDATRTDDPGEGWGGIRFEEDRDTSPAVGALRES
jgi:hypothetical protein